MSAKEKLPEPIILIFIKIPSWAYNEKKTNCLEKFSIPKDTSFVSNSSVAFMTS